MLVGRRRHRADRGAGDDEAEGVDRVARVGREHDVARRGDRGGEAGEPFLRSHRHDDFGLGIDLDPEAAAVIVRLRAAQAGNALRLRIAVRVGLLRDLDQFLDDVRRRRQIGVAHAEVDDVLARRARRRPHAVDLGDDVGRQALDAVEIVGHAALLHRGARWRKSKPSDVKLSCAGCGRANVTRIN